MGQGKPSMIKADVVPVNSESPYFPGGHKSDFCLCASGGGARALSYTMGIYRGLRELGILEQLQGISSVSGGTWASSIYMFAREFEGQAIDAAMLLGHPTKPEDLTLEELWHQAAPMARGITQGNSNQLFWNRAGTMRDNQVWARVVADVILKPFALDDFEAHLALDSEEVNRIKEHNPGLREQKFLLPREDRPKLFVMNGALLAPSYHDPCSGGVVSFQMCPDYTGSPYYPNSVAYGESLASVTEVTYAPSPLCCVYPCWRTSLTLPVGGGLVETFAFGGKEPSPDCQCGGTVEIPAPESPFSLAEAVGISSYAPAGSFSKSIFTSWYLNIRKLYWPIISPAGSHEPQSAEEFQLGDGGSVDNSGLLPLLQRRARKVIWIATSYRSLNSRYDFEGASQETFDPDASGVVDQLYSAFGYGEDNKNEGYFYSKNQVFKREQLLPLCRKLAALKAAGKPCVLRESLEVLPNHFWGITGGYEVSMVLIYLEEVRNFQANLPAETQEELAKGPAGAFENYPIYKTTNNNKDDVLGLTSAQVNLLAAQGEYSVRQNADLFRELSGERGLPTILRGPSLPKPK